MNLERLVSCAAGAAITLAATITPVEAGNCRTSDLGGWWHFSAMAAVHAYQDYSEQIGTTIDRCLIHFDRSGQVDRFQCQERDLVEGHLPSADDIEFAYSRGTVARGCITNFTLAYSDDDKDVAYTGLMTRDKNEVHGILKSVVPDDWPVKGMFALVRR